MILDFNIINIYMNKILSDRILILIHKLFVFFIFFGFLLPRKYLLLHFFTYPILKLHWFLNNNKCFLTELHNNNVEARDYPFMRQLFSDLGLKLTNKQVEYFTDYGFIFSWLITFFRLFIIKK